jgi:hypothetical protein
MELDKKIKAIQEHFQKLNMGSWLLYGNHGSNRFKETLKRAKQIVLDGSIEIIGGVEENITCLL